MTFWSWLRGEDNEPGDQLPLHVFRPGDVVTDRGGNSYMIEQISGMPYPGQEYVLGAGCVGLDYVYDRSGKAADVTSWADRLELDRIEPRQQPHPLLRDLHRNRGLYLQPQLARLPRSVRSHSGRRMMVTPCANFHYSKLPVYSALGYVVWYAPLSEIPST